MSENIEVAVGDRDGQVVLTFSKPTQWLPIEPEQARQIAESIARSAYKCHHGSDPMNGHGRSLISEGVRNRLITRVTLMLTSMENQGKKPAYQAAQVVDQILSEVK